MSKHVHDFLPHLRVSFNVGGHFVKHLIERGNFVCSGNVRQQRTVLGKAQGIFVYRSQSRRNSFDKKHSEHEAENNIQPRPKWRTEQFGYGSELVQSALFQRLRARFGQQRNSCNITLFSKELIRFKFRSKFPTTSAKRPSRMVLSLLSRIASPSATAANDWSTWCVKAGLSRVRVLRAR